jgi:hypothetical protein
MQLKCSAAVKVTVDVAPYVPVPQEPVMYQIQERNYMCFTGGNEKTIMYFNHTTISVRIKLDKSVDNVTLVLCGIGIGNGFRPMYINRTDEYKLPFYRESATEWTLES